MISLPIMGFGFRAATTARGATATTATPRSSEPRPATSGDPVPWDPSGPTFGVDRVPWWYSCMVDGAEDLSGHGLCWISKTWAWLVAEQDEETAAWMITGLRA
jgi:hypothetical protein